MSRRRRVKYYCECLCSDVWRGGVGGAEQQQRQVKERNNGKMPWMLFVQLVRFVLEQSGMEASSSSFPSSFLCLVMALDVVDVVDQERERERESVFPCVSFHFESPLRTRMKTFDVVVRSPNSPRFSIFYSDGSSCAKFPYDQIA